jgi:hypothetical protein
VKRRLIREGAVQGDDFDKTLVSLTDEAIYGRSHLRIAQGLSEKAKEDVRVLNVAPTFFSLTFQAHMESAFLRAAKLFDESKGATSLYSMLNDAEMVAGSFKCLTPANARAKIAAARTEIEGLQVTLDSVRTIRHKRIAHLDGGNIRKPKELAEQAKVTIEELERVLETAGRIVSQIRGDYNECESLNQFIDAGDYAKMLYLLSKAENERLESIKTRPARPPALTSPPGPPLQSK